MIVNQYKLGKRELLVRLLHGGKKGFDKLTEKNMLIM